MPTPVTAPFQGAVTLLVAPGDRVGAGEVVARIEAMKLEAPVTAPLAGTVEQVTDTQLVDGGDVLVVIG